MSRKNFKLDKIDVEKISKNSFIPTGALVIKAIMPSLLSNYSTDQNIIDKGYCPCDGRSLDAQTNIEYQRLYDVIGNIYGGSDNSNFQVPNLMNEKKYLAGSLNGNISFQNSNISHNHTLEITNTSGVGTSNLETNLVASTHKHFFSSSSGNPTGFTSHGHSSATINGQRVSGIGTPTNAAITKTDGAATVNGSAHSHNFNINFTHPAYQSATEATNHTHTLSSTTTEINAPSFTDPVHSHTIPNLSKQFSGVSYVGNPETSTTPVVIDPPYIDVIYFIKL
jgi:microcystin-dependent protein